MFSNAKGIIFLVVMALPASLKSMELSDYKNHPCKRDCASPSGLRPMICTYWFRAEWYTTLSRNCYNCTHEPEDCERDHCIAADGVQRAVQVINRMLPGPAIEVCMHDRIVVNVENMINSFTTTTIHWHGIKQKGTPHMDGVGMGTQCPIMPHNNFQYKFVAKDPGTHFWHSHVGSQRADGIFGALIVRDANDVAKSLYDFDMSEHVLVLTDWMHQLMSAKYNAFLFHNGDELVDSILINGKGVDVRNASEFNAPREVFNVQEGKRYRFRVINAGVQFCPLEVSVDDHELTVIATDGNLIEPINVASFIVMAGERFDFVLDANRSNGTYWFKVKGHADCEESFIYQAAILKYDGSFEDAPSRPLDYESSGPNVEGPMLNPFNVHINDDQKDELIGIDELRSSELHVELDPYAKLYLDQISGNVDKKFYLALGMNLVENSNVYTSDTFAAVLEEEEQWMSPQINNITFMMPNTPLIYSPYTNPEGMFCNEDNIDKACVSDQKKFCSCIHTLNVDLFDLVELVIVDGGNSDENHPIHLHGHSFAVIGMEKLGENALMEDIKEMDKRGQLKRNLYMPPLKDTVTVPSGGYTIVRFYADNPGVWMLHCHIEFHMDAGMVLVFKVGDLDRDLPPPPINWPTCGNNV